ncbi:hypothetical protein [Streptomyces sp. SID12501]|uniref:Uncharacterized protein n=1 Tax=Streptomyces sp. SID12501 TaxID=2706042 RepID=A0A6B3BE56_9ACTN|nr:hypothetical protein [Streptomyces sp. SID12501]NEC84727.1 hypothetical protein [Streptomyces sp. SID12501]
MNIKPQRVTASCTTVRIRRAATAITAALALGLLGAGPAAADEPAPPQPGVGGACCGVSPGTAAGLVGNLLGEIVIGVGDVHDWG